MIEGMNIDLQTLVAVQNERIAAGAIREAQLTAAVQQLTMEVMQLRQQVPVDEEVTEDANANADS